MFKVLRKGIKEHFLYFEKCSLKLTLFVQYQCPLPLRLSEFGVEAIDVERINFILLSFLPKGISWDEKLPFHGLLNISRLLNIIIKSIRNLSGGKMTFSATSCLFGYAG